VVFTDPPIEETESWYAERARMNPFSAYIERHIGRPFYHFHEVLGPPETFRQSEFYRRFARLEGWDKGLSVMFWNGPEMRAMFSLYRGEEEPDFTEAEREGLLRLSRHIEIAIIRVQKINREENFRGALQAFSRTIPAPVILLDWNLDAVFVNLAAYESAAVWNLGREQAARLNPREGFRLPAPIQRAAWQMKAAFTGNDPSLPKRRIPEARTVEHPEIPTLRARINPAQYGPATLARPGFVVLFQESFPPASEAGAANYRERALQALTPAERKVANEVCLGKRNREIAASLNKSTLTVKTQLNAIFQKLNIRNRAELIARLK
jgi:DNA-binding CsgD family transcriptional regulator